MKRTTSQGAATLLDILIDGFEKNESLGGVHCRELPMLDEGVAVRTFDALTEEAQRWKGPPVRRQEDAMRWLGVGRSGDSPGRARRDGARSRARVRRVVARRADMER